MIIAHLISNPQFNIRNFSYIISQIVNCLCDIVFGLVFMLSWARVSRTPCFYLHRIELCLAKRTKLLAITLNRYQSIFSSIKYEDVLFPAGSKSIRGTLRILNFAETRRWSCKQTWRRIVQSLSRSSGSNNFSFWFDSFVLSSVRGGVAWRLENENMASWKATTTEKYGVGEGLLSLCSPSSTVKFVESSTAHFTVVCFF